MRLVDLLVPPRLGIAFRWNLGSAWVGNIGDGIALAAGPLLVASLTRDPVLIAAAAIVQRLPALLLGLQAGALADRVDRRRLVIGSNVARAVVITGLVTGILTATVSIWLVLVALLLVGVAEQFADAAARSVLPLIVAPTDLGVGNARVLAGHLVANELLGPAIGSVLFLVGTAVPFATQAAAVLMAGWLFAKVHLPPPPSRGPGTRLRGDIREGLAWIWQTPAIRTLSVVILMFNLTWGAPWGVLVLWAQDRLGVGAVGFGLLSTAVGVGGLLALAGYDALERRVALSRLMKICLTLEVVLHAALALTTSRWVATALMVVFGCYAFIWASVSTTVRQRATPLPLQGRVAGVYAVGMVGGLLVGQLLGGLIAARWGVTAPFWFAFAGSGLTLVIVWRHLDDIAHVEPIRP